MTSWESNGEPLWFLTGQMSSPTGTLTFLFTDIEGSTRLRDAHPEAMRAALLQHDDLLRACIESHGGQVFNTMGDAFCAAFADPRGGAGRGGIGAAAVRSALVVL